MRAVGTSLCVLIGVAWLVAGCETERSYIELPACADRVELEGQATRISSHRFELDHTFDLPFTKTELSFTSGSGPGSSPVRNYEITSSQPDGVRFFAGAVTGVVGGLLLASAGYDLVVEQRGLFEARPFNETLWGSGLFALGIVAMGTGWHPPQRTFTFPANVCGGGTSDARN